MLDIDWLGITDSIFEVMAGVIILYLCWGFLRIVTRLLMKFF